MEKRVTFKSAWLPWVLLAPQVVALAWLIRTLIEQRRWKQLSRTQSDVHNKILDRFNTTEQLLEYIA